MRFNSGALFRRCSATHDVGSAFRGLKPPGCHRFTATRWEPLFAREEFCLTPSNALVVGGQGRCRLKAVAAPDHPLLTQYFANQLLDNPAFTSQYKWFQGAWKTP